MNARSSFRRRLLWLWFLLWFQRALRLLVRAAWLFPAGIILAWAANQRWGILPDVVSWLLAGALLAVPALFGIVLIRPRPVRFTWRLDRTYRYHEQLSGSWQAVQDDASGPVVECLFNEAVALLSQAHGRILLFGWFLTKDLLSLGIVLLAFWLIFFRPEPAPPIQVEPVQAEALQPLGTDPTAGQIFPGNVPGARTVAGDGSGDEENAYNASPMMEDTLQELGQRLSEHAVSYDAGQAIQRGDLSEAARALEAMADQIEGLSPETREELADAFADAGRRLSTSEIEEEQAVAEALQEAGKALAEGDNLPARTSLDNVATALRQIEEQILAAANALAAGEAASEEAGAPGFVGERRSGDAEAFERLQGVGESFELGAGDEQSGLLSGTAEEAGRTLVGGTYNRIFTGDDAPITNPLLPYRYSWVWRNVVTYYFTPR